ncbi:MAG: hypothetical protein GY861_22045 [bacterium]|nr:hypothetical protein [bacterium]
MKKLKVKQGCYVKHNSGDEVFKVLEVGRFYAALSDANWRYSGVYSLNELEPVNLDEVEEYKVWRKK